jgi:hypothetical protein
MTPEDIEARYKAMKAAKEAKYAAGIIRPLTDTEILAAVGDQAGRSNETAKREAAKAAWTPPPEDEATCDECGKIRTFCAGRYYRCFDCHPTRPAATKHKPNLSCLDEPKPKPASSVVRKRDLNPLQQSLLDAARQIAAEGRRPTGNAAAHRAGWEHPKNASKTVRQLQDLGLWPWEVKVGRPSPAEVNVQEDVEAEDTIEVEIPEPAAAKATSFTNFEEARAEYHAAMTRNGHAPRFALDDFLPIERKEDQLQAVLELARALRELDHPTRRLLLAFAAEMAGGED